MTLLENFNNQQTPGGLEWHARALAAVHEQCLARLASTTSWDPGGNPDHKSELRAIRALLGNSPETISALIAVFSAIPWNDTTTDSDMQSLVSSQWIRIWSTLYDPRVEE